MTFIVLFFATGIYLVEERDTIPSMPHSLWLALVTMTTVGYGDYYPKSLSGAGCGCRCIMLNVFSGLKHRQIGETHLFSGARRSGKHRHMAAVF